MFTAELAPLGLVTLAAFHPKADLKPDPATQTLLLIGPNQRAFWPVFSTSPEYRDGLPNPLDRWSTRVLTPLAQALNARAYYPFGQPYQPFVKWALASGQVWQSPVHLLVHQTHGLGVSFRAAFAFDSRLSLPSKLSQSPCDTCSTKPCRTACPAKAMLPERYDLLLCHTLLDTAAGQNCMSAGCLVRRACPVGQSGLDSNRAAFHMAAFHRT